jgi:hypothetical protein
MAEEGRPITSSGCGCLILIGIAFWVFGSVGECFEEMEEEDLREEMLENSFELLPSFRSTLKAFEQEIDLWKSQKKKFLRMKEAAITEGAKLLASEKISSIDREINKLEKSYYKILEQAEMIAIENEDDFTELDQKTLKDLEKTAKVKIDEAQKLREDLGYLKAE